MEKKLAFVLLPAIVLLATFPFTLPETPEDLKAAGIRALKLVPEFIKEVLQGFFKFLQDLWKWFSDNIWQKVKDFFTPLIKERREIIEQELEKEKETLWQEIKSFVPKATKFLWEKIRSLF